MNFIEHNNGVVFTRAPNISTQHGFLTRHGGVSSGIYSSLNLLSACDDPRESIFENYRRVAELFDTSPNGFVSSRQVHRDDIRICTGADRHTLFEPVPYEADGLITNEKGLPLIIFTADCTPILLHDPVKGAIGAIHAGWRGTVLDIAGKAVTMMQREYGCKPSDIEAAIGPCISKCCFETGPEVVKALCDIMGAKAGQFYTEKPNGKFMVDLKGANCFLLNRAGVTSVAVTDECTMCLPEKYWSHRATDGKRGVQGSCIVLN